MLRALFSGFTPLWGIKKTPSGELAKVWQSGDVKVEGVEATGIVLPQQYGLCTKLICDEILAKQPHIVLMFGATQRNDPMRLERFAINVEKSVMGDNTKIPVKDRPIVQGGPAAYEPTIPVIELVDKLKGAGTDAKLSYHAGTHTCNSILYGVLHWLAQNPQPHLVATGFIHVSFPNDFGVIEDELWSTATFSGIIQASVTLLEETAAWYRKTQGVK